MKLQLYRQRISVIQYIGRNLQKVLQNDNAPLLQFSIIQERRRCSLF